MSRAGNRATPASGRVAGTSPGRSTGPVGTRSSLLPAARWWPRGRPRARSGADTSGRWGVARLVAQREAERRATEEPEGSADPAAPDVAVPDVAVPDARVPEDAAGDGTARGDPPAGHPATPDAVAEDVAADGDPDPGGSADRSGTDAAAEPEDVPPPRAPLPPGPPVPPEPRPPLRTPLVPRPPLPVPRRPHGVRTGPVVPNASDARAARPRIEPDLSLFGFARHTRGRLGARVYTVVFLLVFAVIVVQTIASIV